jgi:Na+/H+ antiporter NhaD/arsenite permease-like protein
VISWIDTRPWAWAKYACRACATTIDTGAVPAARISSDCLSGECEFVDTIVLLIFAGVYLGMILGGLPGLALDRTGVALLGAIALIASGAEPVQQAGKAIDLPTLGLLFGLMVVSAQFRIGGFYARFTQWLAQLPVGPASLLAIVIVSSGLLSAVLANDIVCLAITPLLAEGCALRRWNPVPFLLALACASNVGSAATLIGNPQNMLIGQTLQLHFNEYLVQAALPSGLGLVVIWVWVLWRYRGKWDWATEVKHVETPPFLRWQTIKGFVVLAGIMGAFLLTPWPRDVVALTAAGTLLLSRKVASHRYMQLIDWNLLILFIGLFIVNHAFQHTEWLDQALTHLSAWGVNPSHPAWLFTLTAVLSNLVSNVPATMLLLPVAHHPLAGPILALSSTLAGNFIVVGSIANIIVIDQAKRMGVWIGWREHAQVGIPITLVTLIISALWLYCYYKI